MGQKDQVQGSVQQQWSIFIGGPWARHSSCREIDEKPGYREFILAEVPKKFTRKRIDFSEDSLAEHFSKIGYRFAIDLEFEAFLSQPNTPEDNDILVLGSSGFDREGNRVVKCFDDGLVCDYRTDDVLSQGSHILLVRKTL